MSARRAIRIAFAASLLLAAAGCARKRAARFPPAAPLPAPAETAPAEPETGVASWYGVPYDGRAAANGEIYDMEKLTAAHRTLPFGTVVRVTNLGNGKTVDVRITDRGPFVGGRIVDLSRAAARAIDMIGPGTARVRLDILRQAAPAGRTVFAVQIGAFADRARAESLRDALRARSEAVRIVKRDGNPALWRVLAGGEQTAAAAATLAARLLPRTGEALVVRLDRSPSAPQEP